MRICNTPEDHNLNNNPVKTNILWKNTFTQAHQVNPQNSL